MELEKDPKFVNIQILLAKSMIYVRSRFKLSYFFVN